MSSEMLHSSNTIAYDNQTYWIDQFAFINKTVSQFGMGFIWLIGNIGSILNCLVFYQRTFRNNACAIFFIASSISQLFTFNFALLTRMLQFGYGIQTVNIYSWFCKFRFYLFYIFVAVPRYNLIFASIDRYFASSRDALRRQWSSKKNAVRLIIANSIFWPIMYIQVLVFYGIQDGQCLPRNGVYGIFFGIYIAIDSGVLPLSLMIIFGWLTLRNVVRSKQRIRPSVMANDNRPDRMADISKKDSHLQKMLANQILLFICLNTLNPCFLIYQAFTIEIVKSPLRRTIESFASNMTYALVYLGFALTFTTFFATSKMFRRECRNLIQTNLLRRPLSSVVPQTTTVRSVREDNRSK